jgi:hypothetical protein
MLGKDFRRFCRSIFDFVFYVLSKTFIAIPITDQMSHKKDFASVVSRRLQNLSWFGIKY